MVPVNSTVRAMVRTLFRPGAKRLGRLAAELQNLGLADGFAQTRSEGEFVHGIGHGLQRLAAVVEAMTPAQVHRAFFRAIGDWVCAASTNLPINETADWDGDAAAERIFEWAGGDSFDPDKAKGGFLAYDRSNATAREGYKLPFADVISGRLTAVRAGLDAAAERLDQTDIPDAVKRDAKAALGSYDHPDARAAKLQRPDGYGSSPQRFAEDMRRYLAADAAARSAAMARAR